MTNGQAVATLLAWAAVLIIVALLTLAVARKHVVPTRCEWRIGILAALSIALAGAITASLPLLPTGVIDIEVIRFLLAVCRGVGTALFLALLLKQLGWAPPIIRRFL